MKNSNTLTKTATLPRVNLAPSKKSSASLQGQPHQPSTIFCYHNSFSLRMLQMEQAQLQRSGNISENVLTLN